MKKFDFSKNFVDIWNSTFNLDWNDNQIGSWTDFVEFWTTFKEVFEVSNFNEKEG